MIDGFLTLVGGSHYVVPLSVVSECIDLPAECRDAPDRTCGTFDLRGEVLPYLDLARFYGVAQGPARSWQPGSERARRSLVVVRDGPVRIGLVVDRLLGEHQTVIKPLVDDLQTPRRPGGLDHPRLRRRRARARHAGPDECRDACARRSTPHPLTARVPTPAAVSHTIH